MSVTIALHLDLKVIASNSGENALVIRVGWIFIPLYCLMGSRSVHVVPVSRFVNCVLYFRTHKTSVSLGQLPQVTVTAKLLQNIQ